MYLLISYGNESQLLDPTEPINQLKVEGPITLTPVLQSMCISVTTNGVALCPVREIILLTVIIPASSLPRRLLGGILINGWGLLFECCLLHTSFPFPAQKSEPFIHSKFQSIFSMSASALAGNGSISQDWKLPMEHIPSPSELFSLPWHSKPRLGRMNLSAGIICLLLTIFTTIIILSMIPPRSSSLQFRPHFRHFCQKTLNLTVENVAGRGEEMSEL